MHSKKKYCSIIVMNCFDQTLRNCVEIYSSLNFKYSEVMIGYKPKQFLPNK